MIHSILIVREEIKLMNVLFVANGYSDWGKPTQGFHYYLYKVMHALRNMGHHPILLTIGKRNFQREEDGIQIFTVRAEYESMRNSTLQYIYNACKKSRALNVAIKKIVKVHRVDIIQFTSLEGIALYYDGKIPSVMRLSSYAKIAFATKDTFGQKMIDAMSFIERLSSNSCEGIFAPCRNTANIFGNDIGRRVSVIETPFIYDEDYLEEIYVRQYLRDKKYALFFGTLYAEKGILIIAEILEKFLVEHPDYYFVFVGDTIPVNGENSGNIIRQKAGKGRERVIMFGALPHKQLYPIIINASFVVMPSLMDNFPNACIEAMYFGKIVIGTRGASFEQLITDGENGFLCEIGNSDSLYNSMRKAIKISDCERKEIGEKAKKRIEKLQPKYVIPELLNFYNLVLSRQRKNSINLYYTSLCIIIRFIISVMITYRKIINGYTVLERVADKETGRRLLMQQWLKSYQNGKTVSQYLKAHGYNRISIYGVGEVGLTLLDDLKDSDIEVIYCIDKNANNILLTGIEVLGWEAEWKEVDLIIVTTIDSYFEIRSNIKNKCNYPVMSIENIINSL